VIQNVNMNVNMKRSACLVGARGGYCAFALLISAGIAGVVGGCSAIGPLGETEADFGRHASEERLRRIDRLALDRFRALTPEPTTDPARPGVVVPLGAEVSAAGAQENIQKLRAAQASRQTVELSIEQARAEVLRNNLNLKVALIDPTIARETLNVERARFEAVFTPFATFQSTDPARVSGITGTPEFRTDQTQIGTGISIPLRTGGRVTVDVSETISDTNSPFDSDGTTQSPGVGVSVSQPLLRNAGRRVNTASIVIAGYNQQIVESRTKLEVISQIAQVERAYWRLGAARRELAVRQQQYELATELLAKAERRRAQGVITGVEVTRAQSGVASRLDEIISSETNLLIVQREVKRLINSPGLSLSDNVALVPSTDPGPMEYRLDDRAAELVTLAAAQRMELLESELQALADSVNIDVARNGVLPGLELTGSYSSAGAGTTTGAAYSSFFENRFASYSAGIRGDIPIGNEAAESRLRRAILTRVQRLATLEARRQAIEQDVLDAVDRVRSAWQRILATRQSSILAGRTVDAEQRQFENGLRTATDVLDAATRLADAQSAEIRALTDHEVALVDLAVATGTTLGGASVLWREELPTGTTREALPAGGAAQDAVPVRTGPEGAESPASSPAGPTTTPTVPGSSGVSPR